MLKTCIAGLMLWSFGVCAEPVSILGSIQEPMYQSASRHSGRMLLASRRPTEDVTLLKIGLSDQAKHSIHRKLSTLSSVVSPVYRKSLPRNVQLGMNGVPVLDQGVHGTCVVFALTAAIDAALGKGDYVSQLCQLELGQYLQNNSYSISGWNGAMTELISNQISMFGFVPQSLQKSQGCSGITEYPTRTEEPSEALSVSDHHQMSESLQDQHIVISPLFLPENIILQSQSPSSLLFTFKKLLNQGDRITVGVLLMNFNHGNIGAMGSHHIANDTWILTREMIEDFDKGDVTNEDIFAGHEFVITGYDDDAIATDDQGRSYHGLFTVRSSWSNRVGDQGDFYLSYEYALTFLLDAHHIGHLVPA